MVPEVGIEPTRGRPRQILSLVRLPISPLGHFKKFWLYKFKKDKPRRRGLEQENYFFFLPFAAATASFSCLPTLNFTTLVAGDL